MVPFDSTGRIRRRRLHASTLDIYFPPHGLQEGKAWTSYSSADGHDRPWFEKESCTRFTKASGFIDG